MKFYAPVEISANRSRTPEGFLLCHDVKLARTGVLLYGAGEVPIEAAGDGTIRIERLESEVFRDATLASINGKPFVDDHPPEDVTPANWKEHAVGVVLNPRRGEGADDVYILGDILVTDATAIDLVDSGKREISLGYDAEYEQVDVGLGRQRNIIVNHAALVDKGRCGPACAIGDSAMTKTTFGDRLAGMFGFKDKATFAKALDEEFEGMGGRVDGVGGTTININPHGSQTRTPDEAEDPTEARFKKMEDSIAEIASKMGDAMRPARDEGMDDPDDDTTTDGRTGDSLAAFAKAVAKNAEILAPGTKVPTFDAAADAKELNKRLCACQRKALDAAYATDEGKRAIDPFLVGRTSDFDTMSGVTLDTVFTGAATLMAQFNNNPLTRSFKDLASATNDRGNPITAVNNANREFWNKRSGASAI